MAERWRRPRRDSSEVREIAARYCRAAGQPRRLSLHCSCLLRGFDQLHFAVARAMQNHHLAFGIAENENVTVAEVGLLDSFLESHGAHGDGFVGADEVNL